MIKTEILLVTNNCVIPFQHIPEENVYINKLFATQSIAEHGLGFIITISEQESEEDVWGAEVLQKIIFDLGSSNKSFTHNINARGYSLYDVTSILLSHWHYDHIGALYDVLGEIEEKIPLIAHKNAVYERFFRRSMEIGESDLKGKKRSEIVNYINEMKLVNQPPIDSEKIEALNAELIFSSEPYEVYTSEQLKIILSGEIPRTHLDEEVEGFFFLQDGILKEDKILDDKCLIFEYKDHIVLLNGCCHSGIKNTVDYVKNLSDKPITHIIGGFHMAGASDKRIDNTIEYLSTFQSKEQKLTLFPIHCTGERFLQKVKLANIPNMKAYNLSVGTEFNFYI